MSPWPLVVAGFCLGGPAAPADHLAAAAEHVKAGDLVAALPLLRRHVAENPDHVLARAHLAELLWRLDRRPEAGAEYERFCADAQGQLPLVRRQVAAAHGRLMDLACERHDGYAEQLHRGIGLYLLADQALELGVGEQVAADALLVKAAAALAAAHDLRPAAGRPCWYLHRAWALLGQSSPARVWLRRVGGGDDLTEAERAGFLAAGGRP